MLIIPLHKPLNRRNFPVITTLILAANLFVFFGLQSGDAEVRQRAVEHYLDSSLIEVEWPRFLEYTRIRDPEVHERASELDRRAADADDALAIAERLKWMMMERHQGFQTALGEGRIVKPREEVHEQWRSDRRAYEAILDESFSRRHMLDYDDPRPADLLWHVFMHAGALHLIGNMVFLVALGLLVEGALGRVLFLGAYLACGLAAAGASLWVHAGGAGGGLGASGAIAGLMGLFAVLYNRRPVRFFYWAFVYFDYVRKPAIVLLPLWLGWEVIQFIAADGAMIAYEAHIGGLASGAALGGLVLMMGWERRAFMDEEVHLDLDRQAVEKALAALDSLDVDDAKRQLKPLLARHGDDAELLRTFYDACRVKANDPDLHGAARRILEMPAATLPAQRLMRDTAADYLQRLEQRASTPREAVPALRAITARLPESREAEASRRLMNDSGAGERS